MLNIMMARMNPLHAREAYTFIQDNQLHITEDALDRLIVTYRATNFENLMAVLQLALDQRSDDIN